MQKHASWQAATQDTINDAIARAVRGGGADSQIDLFEGGKETPAIKLPMPYMETWTTPPRLLLDAQGRRHIIAFYHAGEHPAFRDYVVGSDDDPTVILTAKGPTAKASQGKKRHPAESEARSIRSSLRLDSVFELFGFRANDSH